MTRNENGASWLRKVALMNLTPMLSMMLMIKTWTSIYPMVNCLISPCVRSVTRLVGIVRYISLPKELCARFVSYPHFIDIRLHVPNVLDISSHLYHAKTYFTNRWKGKHHRYLASSPDTWVLCSLAIDGFPKAPPHPQIVVQMRAGACLFLMIPDHALLVLQCTSPPPHLQNTCMHT